MTPLITLVDSLEYIRANCYQHQMSEALEQRFDVKYVTIEQLNKIPKCEHVLSRLKMRSVVNNLGILKKTLGARKVMIYDQDPWESFFVDNVYSGSYQKIYDTLNISTFLNISHWWRDRVIECGLPSKFVQVWTVPRYCHENPIPWSQRKHGSVFCGTMYPRRQVFFDSLKSLGVTVEVLPNGRNYSDYLREIANSKIAIRSEQVDWMIDVAGTKQTITSTNALWKRDIETAAQGCFSMRDLDEEAAFWITDIPTIVPFTSANEAVMLLNQIMSLSGARADELIRQGIDTVRNAPGWSQACDVINDVINDE